MINPFNESSSILIIDDNPTAIRMLADMVKDMAHITIATTGEIGLLLARETKPQVILLDLQMPTMDGFEVCRILKSDPTTSDSSVIFVTAETTMESEIKALDVGGVDFISKPLNHALVRARIRTHLKLQHQTAALMRMANRDGLTGLFNRRYFDEKIETEFQRLRRHSLPLSLAFVDIDNFKQFNDRYGHQEGDACLQQIALALNDATQRSGEFVARYGGEEFVAVLPYLTMDQAAQYGEKLCRQVRDCNIRHEDAAGGVVTVSVGVTSQIPATEKSVHQLIDESDKALYLSKQSGKNCSSSWLQLQETGTRIRH